RGHRTAAALALTPLFLVTLADSALAGVTISRADASGGRLRLEGQAIAGRAITVDGVAMATSSSTGSFKIDRSGYSSPNDCNVDVNDGSASAVNVVLSGCSVATPPPPPPPPPSPPAVGSDALDALTLDPAAVQTGTTQSSATLFFSGSSPAVDRLVSLVSSNSSVATVPATVTIPRLSSTGAFPVFIAPTAAGAATISATYGGVTRSATLTASPASLFRITTPPVLPNARVGENYAGFIMACCGQGGPYQWSMVSGTVPSGLKFAGNALRLVQSTGVTGVATRVQTTTFTIRARDNAGNTATQTFSLTVDPASPLVITNQSSQLPAGQVGVAYATGLFPGGGVPPWSWSLVSGALPPGLVVQASPGRVQGTPTTAGAFTFTVRVSDSAGSATTGQFTIAISP
ncbi:MAG: hypothetical protein QOE99_1065, partial [Actinomycetota bacterium]|nr:hypothetical protein [Actinomycetota bacterium]